MPSKDEQQKIGQLLFTLDNLITLHQREFFSCTTGAAMSAQSG